jgi:hypothetical protein
VELEVTDRPRSEDVAALSKGLDEFNRAVPLASDSTKVPLAVFVRVTALVA